MPDNEDFVKEISKLLPVERLLPGEDEHIKKVLDLHGILNSGRLYIEL